jgi:hypothetical protein
MQLRWRGAPLAQRLWLEPDTDFGSQEGDILTQIEPVPQLADRLLASPYNRRSCGAAQPLGHTFFSGTCPRSTKQLEERTATEEVEVTGVRMAVIVKALTGLAVPLPAVLETRQAVVVVRRGPLRFLLSADDALVP